MSRWAQRKRRRRGAERAAELNKALSGCQAKRGARLFSPMERAFMQEHYPRMTRRELTAALNGRFGTCYALAQVTAFTKNHRLRSGRTGRFEKGGTPWNAGTKGQGVMRSNATSFKPGNLPHNKRRLWSERTSKDGFIEISVPERNPHTGHPTRYRHKHVWLWEIHRGPVPEGQVIAFRDGDKSNCTIGNLMLITRAELLRLNQHGYRDMPETLKPCLLALAKVEVKTFELRRTASEGVSHETVL